MPVAQDDISERYQRKAIAEMNELGAELARTAGPERVPVLGSGNPLAEIFLLKYGPQASELHEGVAFFGLGGGVPVTPWAWSFDLTEDEAAGALTGLPRGGVLVVHSPPKGYVDGPRRLGSQAVLEAVEQKQPRLVVCGHIHEAAGEQATIGASRVLNVGPSGVVVDV